MFGSLLTAGAAVLATAAPAASFAASPTVLHAQPGQTAQLTVYDTSGTAPLHAVITLVTVEKTSGKCAPAPMPVRDVALVSPSSITVQPGQKSVVIISVGKGAPSQDDAVIVADDPPASQANVHATAEIGVQLLVSGHGSATAGCTTKPQPKPSHTALPGTVTAASRGGSGGGLTGTGLAAGGVFIAGAAGLLARRRFRKRGQHHG
jgi:hypothetical protein